jgi:putative FmdB family regulatory protein
MPTYEYQCDACEHNFDEFQSMSEEPLKKCPQCGKKKLRRVYGPGAAILFKGPGFYQTDYRSESYKSAAKAEQEKPKPSDAGTTGSDGTSAKGGEAGSGGAANGKAGGKSAGKSSKSAT